MARLSTRISIRWPPSPASEPTDTLVLGVGDYYMDLRVRKSDTSIDWAMTGNRFILSKEPMTIKFTHSIDSRGYTAPDEGVFVPLPNGDDLETGSMPNPDAGNAVQEYEEIWRELPPPKVPTTAWIIRNGSTFLGRLGDSFLAFDQPGAPKAGGFTARREERDSRTGEWSVRYVIGEEEVPGMEEVGEEFTVGLGDKEVKLLGRNWEVCGVQSTAEDV